MIVILLLLSMGANVLVAGIVDHCGGYILVHEEKERQGKA